MATVPQRLRAIGLRLAFGLMLVAVFGLGSLGAFLPVEWPPLLKEVVVGYLLAVLVVRFALVVVQVALAPDEATLGEPDRYRVVPMTTGQARYWHRRLALFIGYFAFGWITVGLMAPLGFSPEVRAAASYLLAVGLLAISLEALWRRPRMEMDWPHAGLGPVMVSIALTAYGVLLWLLWVAGLMGMFWLLVVAVLLPKAMAVGQSAVSHMLRPTEGEDIPGMRRSVLEVCLERGLRAVLIIAAALWLANAWDIDLVELTARDTFLTRILRGILTSVVVVLMADFLWQSIKAAMDARIAQAEGPMEPGTKEAVRQARLRTLLPIFRNILLVVIVALSGLTALSLPCCTDRLGTALSPLYAFVQAVRTDSGHPSSSMRLRA
ncbi:hypothetical protein AAII07_55520 [Microvirga sp. 0TCS3.31]